MLLALSCLFDRIIIGFRLNVLGLSSRSSVHEERTIPIDVPVQLKRCGMAVRLITRASGVQDRGPDPTLVALLSKAHDWLTRLTSGGAKSVLAVAKQEKVTTPYVTRLVYLGCLAPGIVDRILRGQHPPELNAKRLLRMATRTSLNRCGHRHDLRGPHRSISVFDRPRSFSRGVGESQEGMGRHIASQSG